MSTGLGDAGVTVHPIEVKSITVKLPTGQDFHMPAWMAAGIIEGIIRDDASVYSRQMMNVTTGAVKDKPGRKTETS